METETYNHADEMTRRIDALTRLYCAFKNADEVEAASVVKDALLGLVESDTTV